MSDICFSYTFSKSQFDDFKRIVTWLYEHSDNLLLVNNKDSVYFDCNDVDLISSCRTILIDVYNDEYIYFCTSKIPLLCGDLIEVFKEIESFHEKVEIVEMCTYGDNVVFKNKCKDETVRTYTVNRRQCRRFQYIDPNYNDFVKGSKKHEYKISTHFLLKIILDSSVVSCDDGGVLKIESKRKGRESVIIFSCHSMELKGVINTIRCNKETYGCFNTNCTKGDIKCVVPSTFLSRVTNILSNGSPLVDLVIFNDGIMITSQLFFFTFTHLLSNMSPEAIESHFL